MPKSLVDKIKKSGKFNQGFATTEYLAAALLDMQWHMLPADAPLQDVPKFEKAALASYGLDLPMVLPRYRTCYFSHLGRWIRSRLLRLYVVRSIGGRCIPVVQGARRHDA